MAYTKCQKIFTMSDIGTIKKIVVSLYSQGRCKISREVCRVFDWYSENGKPKEWVCREFLLTLEKDGLIILPPPIPKSLNRLKKRPPLNFAEPSDVITGTPKDHPGIIFKRTKAGKENQLWDHLVKNYHYLGYKGHVGRFVKYLVFIENIPVACLGWMGAALKVQSRDDYCEINDDNRYAEIKHIANNFRFLILPWAKVKYLASYILSRNIKLLKTDWMLLYNTQLKFLETFVDHNRFQGICYKAAGWKCIGRTKGYAKTKHSFKKHNITKDVYIYPLNGSK
jgi:hypothetical protein